MKCEEFESRLQEILDDRMQPELDDALRRHSEDCSRCDEAVTAWEQVVLGLELLEPPSPPSDLAKRIASDYLRQTATLPEPAPPPHSTPVLRMAVALAAVILFSLAPIIHSLGTPKANRPGASSMADHPPLPPAPRSPGGQEFPGVLESLLTGIPGGELTHVDQFADPFRPVATSFGVAFGALRKTIPVGKDSSKSHKPNAGAWISPVQQGLS